LDPELDILYDETLDEAARVAHVEGFASETQLWTLIDHYSWDDGFAVPLAVVRHPKCDRALALHLFWEIDEIAQLYDSQGESGLREELDFLARSDPTGFAHALEYCKTLVAGLHNQTYPVGANSPTVEMTFAAESRLAELRKLISSYPQDGTAWICRYPGSWVLEPDPVEPVVILADDPRLTRLEWDPSDDTVYLRFISTTLPEPPGYKALVNTSLEALIAFSRLYADARAELDRIDRESNRDDAERLHEENGANLLAAFAQIDPKAVDAADSLWAVAAEETGYGM